MIASACVPPCGVVLCKVRLAIFKSFTRCREKHAAAVNTASAHRRRAGIGAGSERIAARVAVEAIVVGVGDNGFLAVFAQERDVVLTGEADDFVVCAAMDENRDRLAVAIGHEIDRPLHGGEIAGAIGGNGDFLCAAGRRRCLRRKSPNVFVARPDECISIAVFECAVVDFDKIGFVVAQHMIGQINRRLIICDQHGVVIEIGKAADGFAAGGDGHIDRFHAALRWMHRTL